jgi:hypothetical protein
VLGALAALAASGCLAPPWRPDAGPCPVGVVATDDLPRDLRLRLRVRLNVGEQQLHFEAVAERNPGGIAVLGLAPYGIRLFALRQRGREVEVESPSRRLEKIALWTLDALHRARWIEPSRRTAGDGAWTREGERVSEWWQDGRLVRREFAWEAGSGATPVVSIDYAAADGDARVRGIRVRNPWCGYEARLIELDADAHAP